MLVVDKKCLVAVFTFAHDICEITDCQNTGAFKKSLTVCKRETFFGSDLGQDITKTGLFNK